jgi:hypothetical protein
MVYMLRKELSSSDIGVMVNARLLCQLVVAIIFATEENDRIKEEGRKCSEGIAVLDMNNGSRWGVSEAEK